MVLYWDGFGMELGKRSRMGWDLPATGPPLPGSRYMWMGPLLLYQVILNGVSK